MRHQILKSKKMSEQQQEERPTIFNDEYKILSKLGDGMTSIVYLAQKLNDPNQMVALKIIKTAYAEEEKEQVIREIEIQESIKHENVVQLLDHGFDGVLVRPNGRKITNLVYFVLENMGEHTLFNFIENCGGMGQTTGRFFLA